MALGRVLLPALDSGALLAHPETHPSAAALLSALAVRESALAGRLEAAVLNAHELANANGGSERTMDALIGCLRPDGITSAALAARLDKLGSDGPPEIVPRMRVTATVEPWSMLDDLAEQGVGLEAPVEAAARALSEEVSLATNGADNRPEAERRLPELFTAADATFASCASLPPALELLLVNAAAVLARDERVLPGTPVGDRVLAVLTAATDSPDAGSFLL